MEHTVSAYRPDHRRAIVELSERAWTPVFTHLRRSVPPYVYDAFYPQGWWTRQRQDIEDVLDDNPDDTFVALAGERVCGWVSVRLHPEDSMGEIYILAVDPECQGYGIATSLMAAAHDRMRAAGMSIAMVETGDDAGHRPSRAAYESVGYERWPVARYFRDLADPTETRSRNVP